MENCAYLRKNPGYAPAYGPVHGLPLRTLLRTTCQIKLKTKIKISLTACPIDHSCQRNFARYAGLRWVNVTDLVSVSSTSYFIADHYIFVIFVAVGLHERPGSLRNL